MQSRLRVPWAMFASEAPSNANCIPVFLRSEESFVVERESGIDACAVGDVTTPCGTNRALPKLRLPIPYLPVLISDSKTLRPHRFGLTDIERKPGFADSHALCHVKQLLEKVRWHVGVEQQVRVCNAENLGQVVEHPLVEQDMARAFIAAEAKDFDTILRRREIFEHRAIGGRIIDNANTPHTALAQLPHRIADVGDSVEGRNNDRHVRRHQRFCDGRRA